MPLDISQVNFELNERIRTHFEGRFAEVRAIETPYGQVGELMYHIFEDVNFWTNKLTGNSIQLKNYADLLTEEQFFEEWTKADQRLLKYFKENKNTIDHSKKISLKFGSGKEWLVSIDDIFMHMSHHTFYHRGALGTAVRMLKLSPLPPSNWLDIVIEKIKSGSY